MSAARKGSKATGKTKKTDLPPKGRRNPDPLSGESGAHPVETGVGAALGGAAAGAAGGAIAGPAGAAIGAVAGAVAGGYAGKSVGEVIDPTIEDGWLREFHESQEYDDPVDAYRPAYRHGVNSAAFYPDKEFTDVEDDVRADWEKSTGDRLEWDEARGAVEDAYCRTAQSLSAKNRKKR